MSAVFNSVNPGYLLVSDRPLGFNGKIESLDIKQISDKFHFKYEENIFLSSDAANILFGHDADVEFIWKRINERLEAPFNKKLAICLIDEKVGYGVFTREFIPAGTIIGIYAGLVEYADDEDKDYGMNLYPDSVFRINARNIGGIGRFIQHMPYSIDKIIGEIRASQNIDAVLRILDGNGLFFADKEDLRKIDIIRKRNRAGPLKEFSENQIKALIKRTQREQEELNEKRFLLETPNLNLATANVHPYPIQLHNQAGMYLQAICDIYPNEQLGLSYGLTYWKTKKCVPSYFDKKGRVILEERYLSTADVAFNRVVDACMPALEWRKYPESGRPEGFIGHDIRFFNIRGNPTQAHLQLEKILKENGFDVKRRKINAEKTSIIVDLTNSSHPGFFACKKSTKGDAQPMDSTCLQKEQTIGFSKT